MNHSTRQDSKDMRVVLISKIWAYATGMIAISTLFMPAKHSIFLPVSVASGAALSTMVIWGDRRSKNGQVLPEQVNALKQRIANLETIAGSDGWEFQNQIKQLDQAPSNDRI